MKEPFGRPGKGGPGARPYTVGVGYHLYGRLDAVCGDMHQVTIGGHRCSRPLDSDGVGATRRGAHPGRRFSSIKKGPAFFGGGSFPFGEVPLGRLPKFLQPCRGGFQEMKKTGGHGRAGLRHAPTSLQSNVRFNGYRKGIFDNPISMIFRCILDSNVVGAARRGARPGRRVSHAKPNGQAFGLYVQFCGLSPLIVKKYLSPFFPIGCLIIRREKAENQGSKERFL